MEIAPINSDDFRIIGIVEMGTYEPTPRRVMYHKQTYQMNPE